MKKILLTLLFLFVASRCFSAPTNSMSITVPVAATVINAADETGRYNEVTTKFNAHSHEDLSKTTANTFTIGDNASGSKTFAVSTDDANDPGLRYNTTSNVWTLSNDGATYNDIISQTVGLITIGKGNPGDIQINFDGNAKDYHFGLRDSTDDLEIGLGTVLGTTTHMNFTEDGEITKPLQPCFLARPTAEQSNIAINTETPVVLGTIVFDIGGNFAANTFTAPVTGKYQLNALFHLDGIDIDGTGMFLSLVISNGNQYILISPDDLMTADGRVDFCVATFADMDLGDTVYMNVFQTAGAQQMDILVSTRFSGSLIN